MKLKIEACPSALALLSAGFLPLPILPKSKSVDLAAMGLTQFDNSAYPRKKLRIYYNEMAAGFLLAAADSKSLIENWAWENNHNIAILTGVDGLYVLDFDNRSVFESWAIKYPEIVNHTPIACSPRGLHVYLRSETAELSSSMYLGFSRIGHIKSLGGYIVAPSSINADGRPYYWKEGFSIFEKPILGIKNLSEIGLGYCSPLKVYFDKWVKGIRV